MAQDISKFQAKKIREKFQELNPANDPKCSVWLMSLDNEFEESIGGRMIAAHVGHTRNTLDPIPPHVFTAARCIVEGTHRIATEDEIASHLANEDAQREKNKKIEQDKKININNTMSFPPELVAAFMTWNANQQSASITIDTESKAPKKGK